MPGSSDLESRYFRTLIGPLMTSDLTPVCAPGGRPVAWLDRLLHGGIRLPLALGRPLVVLLSGPPGSGKSLLAQQICYGRASEFIYQKLTTDSLLAEGAARSLYISTEASPRAIMENMEQLGMRALPHEARGTVVKNCIFAELKVDGQVEPSETILRGADPLMLVFNGQISPDSASPLVDGVLDRIYRAWNIASGSQVGPGPALVIVDSLNVLDRPESASSLLRGILGEFPQNMTPLILMLVMDTVVADDTLASSWAYVADVWIRLQPTQLAYKYAARHLEIVKARFQGHAIGPQVAKILPRGPTAQSPAEAVDREGPRPNVCHGGIFVFPSPHFVLSQIRTDEPLVVIERADATDEPIANPDWGMRGWEGAPYGKGRFKDGSLMWPVKGGYELAASGVPLNRCTAVTGPRGPGKGYLAYQWLLAGLARGEHCLVLSFRGNAAETADVLRRVARRECLDPGVVDESKLEVVYQRPGFVTPDEVLHRVITATAMHQPARAVVNSIDRWEACLPLLHDSPIFIPALIDVLNVHHVTSMVVSVSSGRDTLAERGLAANAHTILRFAYSHIPWAARGEEQRLPMRLSEGPLQDGYPQGLELAAPVGASLPSRPKIVVRAVRVPKAAGGLRRAVFDYVDAADAGHRGRATERWKWWRSKQAAAHSGHKVRAMIPLAPEVKLGEMLSEPE